MCSGKPRDTCSTTFELSIVQIGCWERNRERNRHSPRVQVARRAGKEEVICFLEQIDLEKDKDVDPLPLCAGPNGSCSDAGCTVS